VKSDGPRPAAGEGADSRPAAGEGADSRPAAGEGADSREASGGARPEGPPDFGGAWEAAFIATASLVGEPLDAITEALGSTAMQAAWLVEALRSGSRETRARALARGLSETVVALESLRLG